VQPREGSGVRSGQLSGGGRRRTGLSLPWAPGTPGAPGVPALRLRGAGGAQGTSGGLRDASGGAQGL